MWLGGALAPRPSLVKAEGTGFRPRIGVRGRLFAGMTDATVPSTGSGQALSLSHVGERGLDGSWPCHLRQARGERGTLVSDAVDWGVIFLVKAWMRLVFRPSLNVVAKWLTLFTLIDRLNQVMGAV